MKRMIRKNKTRINKTLKWSEIKNAFLGALIVLILSPLAIVIGYKLNEYLSKPILSIEYVFINKIYAVNNLDVLEDYFSKSINYKAYRMKNYSYQFFDLRNIIGYKESLSSDELEKQIKNEISKYKDYLNQSSEEINNKIKQLNKATPSELLVLSISNFDNVEEASDPKLIKQKLRQKFNNLLKQISFENESVLMLDSTFNQSIESIQFKISVLNKGSTDGLIRNEGYVITKGEKYLIKRIPPPQPKNLNAVATYDVTPRNETYYTNAVGRIEKNTMTEFWYILENKTKFIHNYISSLNGSYEVELFDQDNEKINKLVINKKMQ